MFSHASGAFLATLGRIEHGGGADRTSWRWTTRTIPGLRGPLLGGQHHPRCPNDPVRAGTAGRRAHRDGLDYPFPLGDLEFGRYLETDMELSEEDRALMFHGAALEWLGVDRSRFD